MRIGGITLYPFIILREKFNKPNLSILSHEKIHIEQQKELLIVFFYILYLIEWIVRLFKKGNAYENISFEREARLNENDVNYLKERKRQE